MNQIFRFLCSFRVCRTSPGVKLRSYFPKATLAMILQFCIYMKLLGLAFSTLSNTSSPTSQAPASLPAQRDKQQQPPEKWWRPRSLAGNPSTGATTHLCWRLRRQTSPMHPSEQNLPCDLGESPSWGERTLLGLIRKPMPGEHLWGEPASSMRPQRGGEERKWVVGSCGVNQCCLVKFQFRKSGICLFVGSVWYISVSAHLQPQTKFEIVHQLSFHTLNCENNSIPFPLPVCVYSLLYPALFPSKPVQLSSTTAENASDSSNVCCFCKNAIGCLVMACFDWIRWILWPS